MTTPHKSPRKVQQPNASDLERARNVIMRHLSATPMVPAATPTAKAMLKLESFQPTGSFKVRGALAAVSTVPSGGHVLAVSAGNHALGIAWASRELGIPATVVIAETASPAKRAHLERLPIELIRHGQTYDEAEAWTIEQAASADAGTVFISAYNDPMVIAGASTIVDEIVAQAPADLPLTLLVPASGGGLLAGMTLRSSELSTPERPISIIGVELESSPAMSAALAARKVVPVEVGPSIADGLTGNIEDGSVTVDVIAGNIERVVAVSEAEIRSAIRFLVREHGVVAEGAGAAATAALRRGGFDNRDGVVVAIVSGRNIAFSLLAEVLGEAD